MSGATIRAEVITSMREAGMSTRAISSATGLSHMTAARELAGVTNVTPAASPAKKETVTAPTATETAPGPHSAALPSVTGTDGKTYAATAPTPKPRTLKKQTNIRGVIADAFFEQVCEMFNNAARRTTGFRDIRAGQTASGNALVAPNEDQNPQIVHDTNNSLAEPSGGTMTDNATQAFAAALDRYARISRTSDADEPRHGMRTRRDEASRVVAAARIAMVAEFGPAAAAAVEADAELREARRLLDAAHAAREAGLRADELPALLERERLAVARAEAAAGPARAEAEAMAARIALESDHADELAALGAQLGQAARQAVVAAEVARRAFEALDGAESAYGHLVQEARERLEGIGFDHSMTFGGELHPTTTGPELRIAGVAWPESERLGLMPVAACVRVAERLRPVAAEPTAAPLPALTAV